MSGGFTKARRKPSAVARSPSAVSGSVIATKCAPARSSPTASSTTRRKYLYNILGSMVPPDFDETRNSVLAGSISPATLRTREGTVESSTINRGRSGTAPIDCPITSGPSELPPMPSNTTCSNPASRTESANARKSSSRPLMSAMTVNQPSRSAISRGSSRHTVWSPAQMRPTMSSRSIRRIASVTWTV